ncbi:MAG: DUF1674 domain-containing protein [Rickettsiales bacterium]|nr:DUF1674 domain-containing protein [Rickettsiales bacterium]
MNEPKSPKSEDTHKPAPEDSDDRAEEIGGSDKPDPVRYGDWEIGGKCVDF